MNVIADSPTFILCDEQGNRLSLEGSALAVAVDGVTVSGGKLLVDTGVTITSGKVEVDTGIPVDSGRVLASTAIEGVSAVSGRLPVEPAPDTTSSSSSASNGWTIDEVTRGPKQGWTATKSSVGASDGGFTITDVVGVLTVSVHCGATLFAPTVTVGGVSWSLSSVVGSLYRGVDIPAAGSITIDPGVTTGTGSAAVVIVAR